MCIFVFIQICFTLLIIHLIIVRNCEEPEILSNLQVNKLTWMLIEGKKVLHQKQKIFIIHSMAVSKISAFALIAWVPSSYKEEWQGLGDTCTWNGLQKRNLKFRKCQSFRTGCKQACPHFVPKSGINFFFFFFLWWITNEQLSALGGDTVSSKVVLHLNIPEKIIRTKGCQCFCSQAMQKL